MKITIIGAGNMGGALAMGLARSGAVPASDLTVTARHEEKLEKFKALGLQTATDNVEAVRGSDLVFYAVKPWQMEAVVRETAPVLDYGRQTAVSVAPGIRPEDLKAWFTRDGALPQLAYAIPNTAVEVGEG
ncbi:MAG: NAD(P)-binding domain-containing protein, partial [Bacteroidales bacterium]|nr:NAD(P)-binding domain-containing protein [Bacteroidales bacterium]